MSEIQKLNIKNELNHINDLTKNIKSKNESYRNLISNHKKIPNNISNSGIEFDIER
jgi:hypothetical protein